MDKCQIYGRQSAVATFTDNRFGEASSVSACNMQLDLTKNDLTATSVWWGRLKVKACCQMVASVTTVWLTLEADNESSLHCAVSTDVTHLMPDHTGCWDTSQFAKETGAPNGIIQIDEIQEDCTCLQCLLKLTVTETWLYWGHVKN